MCSKFVHQVLLFAAHPRAGLMVMRNDDVFVIAQDAEDLPFLGVEMQPFPRLPIKLPELCGKHVKCKR